MSTVRQLVPIRKGQWVVLELPGGQVLQGRADAVTAKTVQLEGYGQKHPRRFVVSAMGAMTVDAAGVVKQNPTRKGRTMATKKRKAPTAKQLAARERFAEAARSGAFRRKKRKVNPLTRVKPRSPSMRTGKPPTKRLRQRRAETARAPAGFYANPAHPVARYEVRKASRGVAGALLGAFPTKPAAVKFARDYADRHRASVMIVGRR